MVEPLGPDEPGASLDAGPAPDTIVLPWLGNASVPRIAWVTRHVADTGWTALEVQAIAEMGGPLTAADVRRCSGMLAHRLKGVHELYRTPTQRQHLVVDWQESRTAEHARHDGYDDGLTGGSKDIVARALAGLYQGMATYSAQQAELGLDDLSGADAAADVAAFIDSMTPDRGF